MSTNELEGVKEALLRLAAEAAVLRSLVARFVIALGPEAVESVIKSADVPLPRSSNIYDQITEDAIHAALDRFTEEILIANEVHDTLSTTKEKPDQ